MKSIAERLLLVDDEEAFLDIIGKFFRRRKVEFMAAKNCFEALDFLAEYSFDVVVLDVCMPEINGLDCMVELKKKEPFLEIIFLTGHASLGVGVAGMEKGAFDYCLKPIDFEELYEKILLARNRRKEKVSSL